MKHARTYSDDPAAARRIACFARQRGGGGATLWPRCRGPCCNRHRAHSGNPVELRPATLLPPLSGAASARRRAVACDHARPRSEEHTSVLQSLLRISYAVFCSQKNTTHTQQNG